ncbi:MAG TPA: 30S ribosomal protein S20 [Pirellulales bacterium]|jgi:small subunit ribosomal protein S20|nr:30S ribosomal protein S20 [Pirellulales bacterium]
MPNTNSAKKRLKQSLARRTRNRSTRAALKSQTRKVREAVASGNMEQAASEFKLATKKIDQAAAKGVVHDNAAARVKSRLSAAIKAAKQKAKATPA